jgi:hypothetical protein
MLPVPKYISRSAQTFCGQPEWCVPSMTWFRFIDPKWLPQPSHIKDHEDFEVLKLIPTHELETKLSGSITRRPRLILIPVSCRDAASFYQGFSGSKSAYAGSRDTPMPRGQSCPSFVAGGSPGGSDAWQRANWTCVSASPGFKASAAWNSCSASEQSPFRAKTTP